MSGRLFFCLLLLSFSVTSAAADTPPVVDALQLIGGLGNQQALDIAVVQRPEGPALAVAGSDDAFFGGQALTLLTGLDLAPLASHRWPGTGGSMDPQAEVFAGVAATAEGAYFAGRSWIATTDLVGLKEPKAVVVKYPVGPDGLPRFDAPSWVATPSFYPPLQGYETFLAVAAAIESGGAAVYAVGTAEANPRNTTAIMAKLSAAGDVLWQVALGDEGSDVRSIATDVRVCGGEIYTAGINHLPATDGGGQRLMLWKVSPQGAVQWRMEAPDRLGSDFAAHLACEGAELYATVGMEAGPSGGRDGLMVKFRPDGTLIWKLAGGGSGDDVPGALLMVEGRLFLAGSTTSGAVGGSDGFLAEIHPSTGAILSSSLHGGALDDRLEALAAVPGGLVAAGTTASFVDGGNLTGQQEAWLLRFSVPSPEPPAPEPPLAVVIDVMPHSAMSRVPLHSVSLPVAILSSAAFDAPAQVDPATLTFGRTGDEASRRFCHSMPHDVNGDRLPDLLCDFSPRKTALGAADDDVVMRGLLRNGRPFIGRDVIRPRIVKPSPHAGR